MNNRIYRLGNGIGEKILVGSRYFFGRYPDYSSKDVDYIVLVDEPLMFKTQLNMRSSGNDVFYWKRMNPSEYIEIALKSDALCSGKFLIPEFCREIGFTFDMLPQLEERFLNMDSRHLYEKSIYDSYIANGGFSLTDEQRETAYKIYKENKKH